MERTFGDPAIAGQVREDLGLNTSNPATPPTVDQATRDKITEFTAKQDVDEAAFAQTVGQIAGLVDTIKTFAEAVAADGVDPGTSSRCCSRSSRSSHSRSATPRRTRCARWAG